MTYMWHYSATENNDAFSAIIKCYSIVESNWPYDEFET